MEFVHACDDLWELTPKLVVVGVNLQVGGKQEFRLSWMEQVVLLHCSTLERELPGRCEWELSLTGHSSLSHVGHILVALAVQHPAEETTENLSLLQ